MNEFKYKIEDMLLIEAKKNKDYNIANNSNNIYLCFVIKNNAQYGDQKKRGIWRKNSKVTNLDLTQNFHTCHQQ